MYIYQKNDSCLEKKYIQAPIEYYIDKFFEMSDSLHLNSIRLDNESSIGNEFINGSPLVYIVDYGFTRKYVSTKRFYQKLSNIVHSCTGSAKLFGGCISAYIGYVISTTIIPDSDPVIYAVAVLTSIMTGGIVGEKLSKKVIEIIKQRTRIRFKDRVKQIFSTYEQIISAVNELPPSQK